MTAIVYALIDPFVLVTIKMPRNDLKARDIRDLVAHAFGIDETSAHAGAETEETDCVTHTVYLSPGLADMARCVLLSKRYAKAVGLRATTMGFTTEVKVRPCVYF